MSGGGFAGSPPFPQAAVRALADSQLRSNLRQATSTIRQKRDRMVAELADFEQLRSAAAAIKDQALSRLDELLASFEAAIASRGGTVHFAATAAEANSVVVSLIEKTGAAEVLKVKSMTTSETGLNEALAAAGIVATETDLAELIVQLGGDVPSHIVVPAIHRNRSEVRRIFLKEMGSHGLPAAPTLSDDPVELAGAARAHLREKFLRAEVAISGANFAVAETGSLVVVESEGNGRMCLTIPRVLVSVVGIEKLVPSFRDLEVFLQLLARSATGERLNPYTSLWTGRTPGDGPEEVHVVFLDNGRSAALANPVGRQALRCIRCAACLNVCPVYERVGGHAYGSVYPGPIGAVLTPQLAGVASDAVAESLPFASTLCGACYEVCPVKIDIPRLLVHLRARSVESAGRRHQVGERLVMGAAGAVFANQRRLGLAERLAGQAFAVLSPSGRQGSLPGLLGRWTETRDAPVPARESFRDWWKRERASSALGEDAHGRSEGEGVTPTAAGRGPAPLAAGAPIDGPRDRRVGWAAHPDMARPGAAPQVTVTENFVLYTTRAARFLREAALRCSALPGLAGFRRKPALEGPAGPIGALRGVLALAPKRAERARAMGTARQVERSREGALGLGAVRAERGREAVLGAVRAALTGAPFGPVEVARSYRGLSAAGLAPPVELFVGRVSEYRANARVVADASEARTAIAAALGAHAGRGVVVPAGFPDEWLPGEDFVVTVDDGQLSPTELDDFDATVSCCTVAVAETGTVVLTGGSGQGRRLLSLVPDHLVLMVRAEQIVPNIPDAIARLAGAPLQTWISGPSATSDIELNRVEGVHGPRRLDVLVVAGGEAVVAGGEAPAQRLGAGDRQGGA